MFSECNLFYVTRKIAEVQCQRLSRDVSVNTGHGHNTGHVPGPGHSGSATMQSSFYRQSDQDLRVSIFVLQYRFQGHVF